MSTEAKWSGESYDVTQRQDFSASLEMTHGCFHKTARNFDL